MNGNNIIKIRVEQKSGIKIEQTFGLAEKFNVRTKDIVALNTAVGTKKITSNGIHDVGAYKYADVLVSEDLPQVKEFEYTENDTYSIEPDEGYFLERVDVKVNVKGIDTSDATAVAEDILKGRTAYVNDQKIIGSIETYDYSNSEGSLPQPDEGTGGSVSCGDYWLGNEEEYNRAWDSGAISSTTICFITNEATTTKEVVQEGSIVYIYEGVKVTQNGKELLIEG